MSISMEGAKRRSLTIKGSTQLRGNQIAELERIFVMHWNSRGKPPKKLHITPTIVVKATSGGSALVIVFKETMKLFNPFRSHQKFVTKCHCDRSRVSTKHVNYIRQSFDINPYTRVRVSMIQKYICCWHVKTARCLLIILIVLVIVIWVSSIYHSSHSSILDHLEYFHMCKWQLFGVSAKRQEIC